MINAVDKGLLIQNYLILIKKADNGLLTLCSPSSTFGTYNGATENELNPIVLYLCTHWHCLNLALA